MSRLNKVAKVSNVQKKKNSKGLKVTVKKLKK